MLMKLSPRSRNTPGIYLIFQMNFHVKFYGTRTQPDYMLTRIYVQRAFHHPTIYIRFVHVVAKVFLLCSLR